MTDGTDDTAVSATGDGSDDGPAAGSAGDATADDDPDGTSRVRSTLFKGALGLFVLLAVVATLRLYLSVSDAIGIWVTREYRPLVSAAFNLVVLAVAGIGITVVARRLADG
jgi:hypothetical protein